MKCPWWLLLWYVFHYATWPFQLWLALWLLGVRPLEIIPMASFFVWIVIQFLFNGCPYTWFEQWLEKRVGLRLVVDSKYRRSWGGRVLSRWI